jgi:hypothetical protein
MALAHADVVTFYNKNRFSVAYDSSMESQQPSNHFLFLMMNFTANSKKKPIG